MRKKLLYSLFLVYLLSFSGYAQTRPVLNLDGEIHQLELWDFYKDSTHLVVGHVGTTDIPNTTNMKAIKFRLRGGDGGDARLDASNITEDNIIHAGGGKGADIEVRFLIGTGQGMIPPGSRLTWVIGEKGDGGRDETTAGVGFTYGSGAGGTGLFVNFPDNINDPPQHLLAVAGGGGGAYVGAFAWTTVDFEPGGLGQSGTSGQDGNGSDYGDKGTNGNGGKLGRNSSFLIPLSGGGGGYYSHAEFSDPCGLNEDAEEWGGKKARTDPYLFPGRGGWLDGCNIPTWHLYEGARGFGGGGAAAGAGGGGGGYSGGGGGGNTGRGGGGGSYNSPWSTFRISHQTGTTTSPVDGYITYQVELNTPPVAICKNITVDLLSDGTASITAEQLNSGSSDIDDDPITFSVSKNSFNCNDVGNNAVILTVSDNHGASSSCTANVLVRDVTPPTAICKDITVSLDENGLVSILPEEIDNGSNDVCGIQSLSLDISSFTSADLGDNVVTLTAVDNSGNFSTCTAMVTIIDISAPEIICNSIDIVLDDEGRYLLTPADLHALTAGTTDNADVYSDIKVYARPVSFYCDDVGEVKVDLVAQDKAGNRAFCRTIVNVIDTSSLEMIEIEDVLVELDSGVCETQITYPEIVLTNTCATVSQVAGLGSEGIFPVGTTIETWKATNTSGDEVSVSFNVIVTSVNVVPTVDSITDIEADENTLVVNVPLSGISYGADCIEQDILLSASAQKTELIAGIAVNYSSPDSTGSLDISLVPDAFGTDTITVTVNDSKGAMVSERFVITINQVNKLPTINAIADLVVEEDNSMITIPISGISFKNNLKSQTVIITATGTNPDLVSNIAVNYTAPDSTGSIDLTIEPNKFGEETITVTVSDGLGDSVTELFGLTVTPVNDPPYLVLPLPDGSVNASHPYQLPLTTLMGVVFDDVDDDMLTFDIKQEGTDGLPDWVVIESNILTATPMIADTGTYSFVVTATDAAGAMAADTFMLYVEGYPTGINDFDDNSFDVKMYPNPTSGVVNLKINSSELMDAEVVVRSITGSEIFRKDYRASEEISIDLSEHVSGIYFIMLQQGDKNTIKKLILDKK